MYGVISLPVLTAAARRAPPGPQHGLHAVARHVLVLHVLALRVIAKYIP